jgi:hypothetical protein
MKINKIFIVLLLIVIVLASCENGTISYPDFDYQTVYFANQFPVRTVELGEDLFVDNSIDNQHKVIIKATMGGVRDNRKNIEIDFKVDESLCDELYFSTGDKVEPMPSSYYNLASNKIMIPSGSILGGVEVQLTDDFFADPKSLVNTYVIPLLMTKVQGADSILQGVPAVADPHRCIDADWTVKPRDFVLYAVKYVNPWHGNYLRRGLDQITRSDGSVTTFIRHNQYVENDELVKIVSSSLNTATLSLTINDISGITVPYNLILTFADDGTCVVSSNSDAYEITGTGKFVLKGEKKSMGGYDRNALYLDYDVKFKNLNLEYSTKDTLVVRDRGVSPAYFTVIKK